MNKILFSSLVCLLLPLLAHAQTQPVYIPGYSTSSAPSPTVSATQPSAAAIPQPPFASKIPPKPLTLPPFSDWNTYADALLSCTPIIISLRGIKGLFPGSEESVLVYTITGWSKNTVLGWSGLACDVSKQEQGETLLCHYPSDRLSTLADSARHRGTGTYVIPYLDATTEINKQYCH